MKKKLLIIPALFLCLSLPSCKRGDINHLTFKALENETYFYALKTNDFNDEELPNISYSLDNSKWEKVIITNEREENVPFIMLNKNQTVYLKGNNPKGFSKGENKFIHFSALNKNGDDVRFEASGNIMSLIDDGKCKCLEIPNDYCFTYLFGDTDYSQCRVVTSPLLPAITLKPHCYDHMFFDDEDLTTPSVLPSLKMEEKCYAYMFSQCTSLQYAPPLLSTITAPYCYDHMFYGNSSLSYIDLGITDWDREGNFPCCFWVSFDGRYPMSQKGIFRCKKELVPNISDPNNFSETRIPYHWEIVTY